MPTVRDTVRVTNAGNLERYRPRRNRPTPRILAATYLRVDPRVMEVVHRVRRVNEEIVIVSETEVRLVPKKEK